MTMTQISQRQIVHEVAHTLDQMISPTRGRLLVAVSGGPDSVCLLAVLDALHKSGRMPNLALHVAHMNYGLRGNESDEDEAFVRQLAADRGLPVSCEQVSLLESAPKSVQAHARELRYAFFDRLCRLHQLSAIATGHTADDQAETILMWLLRGSGVTGLAGIPSVRNGGILRPLLHVRRAQVLEYLTTHHVPYRLDSSNSDLHYQRNRIRHELLPQLKHFSPQICSILTRTSDILSEDAALLEELQREHWHKVVRESEPHRVSFDVEALQRCPLGLQRRLIRRAWDVLHQHRRGLHFRHVSDIVEKLLGARHRGRLDLPAGLSVQRHGSLLIFEHAPARAGDRSSWACGVPLAVPGEVALDQGRRIVAKVVLAGSPPVSHRELDQAACRIDLDRAGFPFMVRSWKPGDWFCPLGMQGKRKKLQDFFVDQKVPREQREQVPVVTSPVGIVWVAGYRGDERVRPGLNSVRLVTLSFVTGVRP